MKNKTINDKVDVNTTDSDRCSRNSQPSNSKSKTRMEIMIEFEIDIKQKLTKAHVHRRRISY